MDLSEIQKAGVGARPRSVPLNQFALSSFQSKYVVTAVENGGQAGLGMRHKSRADAAGSR